MRSHDLYDFALQLPETTEGEAFGPGANVFKVADKVFAILQPGDDKNPAQVTLKCEPGLAQHLRDQYPAVTPGYHMNRLHWNTVLLDSSVPDEDLREMVEHSYDRVVAGMPRAVRDRLAGKRGQP